MTSRAVARMSSTVIARMQSKRPSQVGRRLHGEQSRRWYRTLAFGRVVSRYGQVEPNSSSDGVARAMPM